MGVPVTFTALSGAEHDQPLCYLLQLGDCGILLDCGWDDAFNVAQLEPVIR